MECIVINLTSNQNKGLPNGIMRKPHTITHGAGKIQVNYFVLHFLQDKVTFCVLWKGSRCSGLKDVTDSLQPWNKLLHITCVTLTHT